MDLVWSIDEVEYPGDAVELSQKRLLIVGNVRRAATAR
jgi:hypothetical protein